MHVYVIMYGWHANELVLDFRGQKYPQSRNTERQECKYAEVQICKKMVALVPALPRFDLPLVFTIIHKIGRLTKIKMGKAWEHLSRERRHVDVGGEGPNCQSNAQDHPFERSTAFLGSRP